MLLIVGLGNPGPSYITTRHNIGFAFLDLIAASYSCSDWSRNNKFSSDVSIFTDKDKKIVLCKPVTFMNLSGVAVQSIAAFYKIPIENIVIYHDDIDIPLGKLKYKVGGGHGGHNGLKSIDKMIGKDYHRVRIGIGRPINPNVDVANYVLSKFFPKEQSLIDLSLNFLLTEFDLIKNKQFDDFKHKCSVYNV